MKYKKFRYNMIIFGLVAIIGCSVAIPLSYVPVIDDNHGSVEDVLPDIDEIPEIEIEDKDDPNYEEDKFLYTNAWGLINYSLDNLYNGAGFNSVYTQSVTNVADIMGMTVVQNVKGNIKRSGTQSLEERFFYSSYTGIGSDQVKNEYDYFLIDSSEKTFQVGKTKTYDHNSKTADMSKGSVETMDYKAGVDKYCVLFGNEFPVETNQKTVFSTVEHDVEEDKNLGKYRTIQVKYNVNKIPKNISDFYASTGQLVNINYGELTITYKINVNTGRMISISRVEKMTAINPDFNTGVTSTVITLQTFLQVDKEQEIVEPK